MLSTPYPYSTSCTQDCWLPTSGSLGFLFLFIYFFSGQGLRPLTEYAGKYLFNQLWMKSWWLTSRRFHLPTQLGVHATPAVLNFAAYSIIWGIKKKRLWCPGHTPDQLFPNLCGWDWGIPTDYHVQPSCAFNILLCLPRSPSRIRFQLPRVVNCLVTHPIWGSSFLSRTPSFAFRQFLGSPPSKLLILNPGLRESKEAEVWKVSVSHLEHHNRDIWSPALHRACHMMEETGIQKTIT